MRHKGYLCLFVSVIKVLNLVVPFAGNVYEFNVTFKRPAEY